MSLSTDGLMSTRTPAPAKAPARRRSAVQALTRRFGLKLESRSVLSIRRRKRGKGYAFVREDGRTIQDAATVGRLKSLAMPPAYEDVLYAENPAAHLQAVGRDAAGRLQYRYHPDWEKVREIRKARRLMRLVEALPTIRRSVAQRLAGDEPTRDFALAPWSN